MAATPLTSLRRRRRRRSDGPGRRRRRRRKAVPRAKAIGLSVADGSDKSPPINNNGSSTINASTARPVHNRHPSSLSSKGAAASNQPVPEVDDSTIDTELPYHRERTCRSMHILSSPTIIKDTGRYERNSLLFAVGFVLHRSVDPRPFWPVLSNLSLTLRDMEVESEFLSNASTRSRVQIVLEDVLVSLNSGIGRMPPPAGRRQPAGPAIVPTSTAASAPRAQPRRANPPPARVGRCTTGTSPSTGSCPTSMTAST